MKTLISLVIFLILSIFTQAQEKNEGITITVTVPNITSTEGEVIFGLFDENTFMKKKPLKGEKSSIKDGVAKIIFTNVTEGTYAISCFHDKNGNKKMDFESNGMPKENYGVSNNNMSYGPPAWTDAKFNVEDQNLDIEIRM